MLRRPPTTLTLTPTDLQVFSHRSSDRASAAAKARQIHARHQNPHHTHSRSQSHSFRHAPTSANPESDSSAYLGSRQTPPPARTPHPSFATGVGREARAETPTEPDLEEEHMNAALSSPEEAKENSPAPSSSSSEHAAPNDFSSSDNEQQAPGRTEGQRLESEESDADDTFHAQTRTRTRGGRARGQRERIMGTGGAAGRGRGRNPSAALPRVERRGVGR